MTRSPSTRVIGPGFLGVIESHALSLGGETMLAEKFILLLEALLKSDQYPNDGSVRVKSQTPHVPIELPKRMMSHGL